MNQDYSCTRISSYLEIFKIKAVKILIYSTVNCHGINGTVVNYRHQQQMLVNYILKLIYKAYLFGQVIIGCKSALLLTKPTLVLNVINWTFNCLESNLRPKLSYHGILVFNIHDSIEHGLY